MSADEVLAERFEASRARLRALAHRMLGSLSEADDAVQEAWLRLQRADASGVDNLAGWLTTVVGRICLDMLRSRAARLERPAVGRLPVPLVERDVASDPEQEVLLGGAVGAAVLVVLETLAPAERIAFVLHDVFALPFEEIARIVDRSPAAARQLASRARRRVRGAAGGLEPDLQTQRRLVEAFLSASRAGDLQALLRVLDPGAVLRVDAGGEGGFHELRGARAAAGEAIRGARGPASVVVVRVNGAAGLLGLDDGGRPSAVLSFAVSGGKITEVDVLADRARLAGLVLC